MIRFRLYQNRNKQNMKAYGKYYPRPKIDETYDLEQLAKHMASHNTPYSKGVIRGIITDMVLCIKELLLDGKNVKVNDLAIFSVGIRTKDGADSPLKYSVAQHISGVKLRCRATGLLSPGVMNLEASIKEDDPLRDDGTSVPDNPAPDNPSSGNTGSGSGNTGDI